MATLAESAANEAGLKPSPYAFSLSDGYRVAFLGDALLEREQWHGHLEDRLTVGFPGKKIRVRNFAWNVDTPTGCPRANFDWKEEAEWLERILRPLSVFRPTVVVLGYRMASSFDGEGSLGKFRADLLRRLIDRIHESLPKSSPRFVLAGPIRHERLGGDWPNLSAQRAVISVFRSGASDCGESRLSVCRYVSLAGRQQ